MKIPVLRTTALGEFSPWARQFLSELQESGLIELGHEASVEHYCKSLVPSVRLPVIVVENQPEIRNHISALRHCGRPLYIICIGRSFSKEDLALLMENRIYCVFENMRSDDKGIAEKLGKLSLNTEEEQHFEQLIRAMKSILLQAEADEAALPIVHEIKAAITKLELHGLKNEFSNAEVVKGAKDGSHVPFHKTQNFGDAIMTVHDLERTGVLWVRGPIPEQEAKIEFLQGKIISAVAGDTHGLKAIYRVFLWDGPRFLFNRKDPNEAVVVEQLDVSMRSLVKQGETLRDRYEKIRKELPPETIRLEIDPHALHGDTSLPFVDFSTLASIIEFGAVSHVLDFNPLPDVDIYESLIRLRRGKVIRVAAHAQ